VISPEYIDAMYGIVGSIIGTAVGYGILKHKVDMLVEEKSRYVLKEVYDATMSPLKESLDTLEGDVKEILKRLGNRVCDKCISYRED